MIADDAAKVEQYKGDVDQLEKELLDLGEKDIEMYIREIKMELRCARSLADEKVYF